MLTGEFAHNAGLLAAPVAVFVYYVVAWLKIGPEPPLASVQILYEPPRGLSPSVVRFLSTAACDGRSLAAVVAQLAARGCLEIHAQNGKYKLSRTGTGVPGNLAPEEIRVRDILFENGPEIVIQPGQGIVSNRCLLAILQELHKQLDGSFFTRNTRYLVGGLWLSLVIAMSAALAEGRGLVFDTAWLFVCAYFVGTIVLAQVIPSWRRVLRGLGGFAQTVPAMLLLAVFGVAFAILCGTLATRVSPAYPWALSVMVFVNLGWAPALKRMTPRERQALAQIAGFPTFLERVEEDRMQRLSAETGRQDAATTFLPYAIALGTREPFGERLTQAFLETTTAR